MQLKRSNNNAHELAYMRNKHVFYISGTEDQAELIARIDSAIGNEIYGVDGNNEDITWEQECCDNCADYNWGYGCGWIVDKDDIPAFKELWKRHKKLVK